MAAVVLFLLIAGSFVPFVDIIAQVTLLVFVAVTLLDATFLCIGGNFPIVGSRQVGDRFSNGDENFVSITVCNHLKFIFWAVVQLCQQ